MMTMTVPTVAAPALARSSTIHPPATAARQAPALVAEPAPGTYVGPGFDACSAPSTATMRAWLASPYRAVGIYFGGGNRACAQPNLTADWVTTQQADGWHLLPIYLGPQPVCTTSTKPDRFDAATATARGRSSAEDAVTQANRIGLPADSVLVYDMEAYRTDDASCRSAVLAFMNAWTSRLHDLHYLSGFYSSMASGVADQVAAYPTAGYAPPDHLDFARWDGVATVSDPALPGDYWSPHRRVKQYRGDHDETWGGVTINIDNDQFDVAPLPRTPFGDYDRNGWPDVVARDVSTAQLHLYQGNGSYFSAQAVIGTGWNGMDTVARLGDFDRDGYEDLITRQAVTGQLWLYPNALGPYRPPLLIGSGWQSMREITPVGDLDGDGYPDVVAIATDNSLLLYQGRGTGLVGPVRIGTGWNGLDELAGVGDFNHDGSADLLARVRASGDLYVYLGSPGGVSGGSVRVGVGWNSMRDLVGVGDFDRDGHNDVIGVESTTGLLHLYHGDGAALGRRVTVGTGWQNMRPLA